MVYLLLDRTFSLEIDKAYADFKASLAEKGCKIISEDPPKHILVKQGSLWGVSPTTAKKTVDATFKAVDSGTRVTCSSHLSSDWKNLTIAGCALAAVLVGLCLWMALDLSNFMVTGKPTFWSWLVTVNGNLDFAVAQAFVNLTKALAGFLSVIIVLEIAVAVHAYSGIDRFVQGILDALLNHEPAALNVHKQ
jgi:hypothetical protein